MCCKSNRPLVENCSEHGKGVKSNNLPKKSLTGRVLMVYNVPSNIVFVYNAWCSINCIVSKPDKLAFLLLINLVYLM